MRNLQLVLMIFTLGIFSQSYSQDFHASTTKVEYESGSLKLTAKFFTEDLERAIGVSAASKSDFDNKARSYSSSRLTLKVNGNLVGLTYVGSQTTDKSTRIYLKADNIGGINDIEIKNAMLLELFPDQQNLVTFDVNGVRKSFTAKKGNESGKVTF